MSYRIFSLTNVFSAFYLFVDSTDRSSNKKPFVMETLKRKSSDTYLNAVKVSTNINNNCSNKSSSSSSSLLMKGPTMAPSSENSSQSVVTAVQPPPPPPQTSSSFYNDQKYLHKKFKRIASVTIENSFNNNNNSNKDNNQEETENVVKNHTMQKSATSEPVKINENNSSLKSNNNNNNNFSSANNHHHHSIINNNNHLINNFKVVQNHTTPSPNQIIHSKSVPQVMTAYENYIITKEKLTHHQIQQIDASKMTSSSSSSSTLLLNNVADSSSTITYQHRGDKHESQAESTPGRYVCPFCQLVCTKPSVLEKHIRAHTNERPYPCNLCGFAFKTKSNLHKHFK